MLYAMPSHLRACTVLLILLVSGLARAEPTEPEPTEPEPELICQVPDRVSLVAPDDYPPHQARVRACLHSLVAEPDLAAAEIDRRGAYVLKWLTGVPYLTVRVRLDGAARKALKKSKDPSVESWYLYGVALATLDGAEEGEPDPVQVELTGLQAMLTRYQAVRAAGGKKNKVLEGWAELDAAALRAMAAESVASTEVE